MNTAAEHLGHSSDSDLLTAYVEHRDEVAFAELVRRYQSMVLGACGRRLGNPAHAQDAAQMTFLLMVQKARSLHSHSNLAGWLYQTANFQASNLMRKESLRARSMVPITAAPESSATSPEPLESSPVDAHLDEALMTLRQKDREAVVLRFFSGHSLRGVGDAQGTTEEAARKRITRALERMADFLRGRGVLGGSVAAITTALSVSTQAVPANFVASVTASAHSAGLASVAAAYAAFWSKVKFATILAAVVSVPLVWQWNVNRQLRKSNEQLRARQEAVATVTLPVTPDFPAGAPSRAGTLPSLQLSEPNRLFQLLGALFAAESQQRQDAKITAWTTKLHLRPPQVDTVRTCLAEAGRTQHDALHRLSSGEVEFEHVLAFFGAEQTAHQQIRTVLDADQLADFGSLLEHDRSNLARDLALWRLADLQPALRFTDSQKPAVLSVLTETVSQTLKKLMPPQVSDLPALLAYLDELGAAENRALTGVLTPEQLTAFQDQTIRRRQALDYLLHPPSR